MNELNEFLRNPGIARASQSRDEQSVQHPIEHRRVAIRLSLNDESDSRCVAGLRNCHPNPSIPLPAFIHHA